MAEENEVAAILQVDAYKPVKLNTTLLPRSKRDNFFKFFVTVHQVDEAEQRALENHGMTELCRLYWAHHNGGSLNFITDLSVWIVIRLAQFMKILQHLIRERLEKLDDSKLQDYHYLNQIFKPLLENTHYDNEWSDIPYVKNAEKPIFDLLSHMHYDDSFDTYTIVDILGITHPRQIGQNIEALTCSEIAEPFLSEGIRAEFRQIIGYIRAHPHCTYKTVEWRKVETWYRGEQKAAARKRKISSNP